MKLKPAIVLKSLFLLFVAYFCSASACFAINNKAQEKFEQAEALIRENRSLEAIQAFSQAISAEPDNWQFYSKRASAYSSLAQHREAIADYTKAISLHPSDANLYFLRSYAYSRVRDGKNGLTDADEALRLGCRDAWLYFARALALQTIGRFEEALNDAITFGKLMPSDNSGHQLLADIYWDMGKFREALAELDKVIELNPLNPMPYLDRGQNYASLNDLVSARENYRTYLRLVPGTSDAVGLTGRARAYNELKEHKEALDEVKRALCQNPEEFTANMLHFHLAWAPVGSGQYQQALGELDRVLKLRPDFNLALRQRSIAHMNLGNNTQALSDARAAVLANRRSFDNHLQLVAALKSSGQTQEALEAVDRALSMRPSSVEALKLRADCYLSLHKESDAAADRLSIERLSKQSLQTQSSPNPGNNESRILPPPEILAGTEALKPSNRPIKDKWALIVGISKFKDARLNLRFPAKDALDFKNYLINEGHFAADHVKLLTDEQASRANILSACGDKWLPRVANPDDLVLIYISSHGSPSEADLGGVNYVIAHDTTPDELYATGIPLQDLSRIIKKRVHCERIVIILDACHSGAADPSAKGLFRGSNVSAEEISVGTGQLVISSSQPSQQSWEFRNKPNSVFTKHLIDALKSKGDKTPLKDAFEYLKEKVQTDVLAERGQLQVPMLKSQWDGADLIIGVIPLKPRPAPSSSLP